MLTPVFLFFNGLLCPALVKNGEGLGREGTELTKKVRFMFNSVLCKKNTKSLKGEYVEVLWLI